MGVKLDDIESNIYGLNLRVMKMELLLHQLEKDIDGIYLRLEKKTLQDIEEIAFRSVKNEI